jgi:glycerophosphoryl diester phosphodiesterase
MDRKPVIAVGHRGASAYAPENTVAAFDEAIRLGAKAVEFDLRVAGDGTLVVLHDDTVDRTTNGRGPVAEYAWLDLLRLDAGSWMHPRFTGLRIPTLDEALLAIGPAAVPVIELKVPVPAEQLLWALKRFDLEGDALVLSFEEAWLHPLRQASKELALGLLADAWSADLPARARQLAASGSGADTVLCLNVDVLGGPQVAAAAAQGLEVWCFTANDVGMVAACAAMGVTGIITDRPDLIRTR